MGKRYPIGERRREVRNHFFVLLILCIGGCSSTYNISTEEDGTKILTGICDRTIFKSEPEFKEWFEPRYAEYSIDEASVKEINSLSHSISFLVFFGTWCSDSKQEIPRFFKIIDAAKFSASNITMYGLDRSKKSDDGMTEKFTIHNVPTIIVLKEGRELGRIVEYPQETLEKDLAAILRRTLHR